MGNEAPAHEGNEAPAGAGNEAPAHQGKEAPAGAENEAPAHEGNEAPAGAGNEAPAHQGNEALTDDANDALAGEVVDAINRAFGSHAGFRGLHARGALCAGVFRPAPAARAFCAAELLAAGDVPALVRFSNASGNPADHDGLRDARGMAVKLDGGWDLVTVTAPSFLTRTVEDFLALISLRASGDGDALGAWLGEHPETGKAISARFAVGPPESWTGMVYNGIHAFRFIAPDGTARWARTRFLPGTPTGELEDDEAMARDPHYLDEALDAGLPAGFALVARLAEEGDTLSDPTQPWPEERSTITLGHLEVQRREDRPEPVVFDPLRLPAEVGASDDPILRFRPAAYSESVQRRVRSASLS